MSTVKKRYGIDEYEKYLDLWGELMKLRRALDDITDAVNGKGKDNGRSEECEGGEVLCNGQGRRAAGE